MRDKKGKKLSTRMLTAFKDPYPQGYTWGKDVF